MQEKQHREQRKNWQKNKRRFLLNEIKIENELMSQQTEKEIVRLEIDAGGDFSRS